MKHGNSERTLLDGTEVKAYKFHEPVQRDQNVKLLNLIQHRALPESFGESQQTKEWAQSMDSRTTPANGRTISRMSAAKRTVIETKKTSMFADMKARGQRMSCQFDMMSKDKISYASMNITWVHEHIDVSLGSLGGKPRMVWEVRTDVLDFVEFPDEAHTSVNIFNWAKGTAEKFGLELSDFVIICPDGASNCRGAMVLMQAEEALVETPTCLCHQLGRSVLTGAGLQGKLANSENDVLRLVLEKQRRLSGRIHRSPDLLKKLETVPPSSSCFVIATRQVF